MEVLRLQIFWRNFMESRKEWRLCVSKVYYSNIVQLCPLGYFATFHLPVGWSNFLYDPINDLLRCFTTCIVWLHTVSTSLNRKLYTYWYQNKAGKPSMSNFSASLLFSGALIFANTTGWPALDKSWAASSYIGSSSLQWPLYRWVTDVNLPPLSVKLDQNIWVLTDNCFKVVLVDDYDTVLRLYGAQSFYQKARKE